MKIEFGTLMGEPVVFLQGVQVSAEIEAEFVHKGVEQVGVVESPEVAIPLEIAVTRKLVVENNQAVFEE